KIYPEYKNMIKKKIFKSTKNMKKILCRNMIIHGNCNYSNKCMYAHNLNEQNIDNNRKIAYDLLNNNTPLNNIDLRTNDILYNAFVGLTEVCGNCVKNKCTGGY